jgi:SWI/SNF-related matrix-associated actin-dependent regulator 1 of chromatin subfamily A
MILDAPFHTLCADCGRPIPKGYPVSYDRATLKIRHVKCSEKQVTVPAMPLIREQSKITRRPAPDARGPHGAVTVPAVALSPPPSLLFDAHEIPTTRTALPVENVLLPDGLAFLPFQREGIAFALNRFGSGKRGVLLADEMGLGKTVQGIGILKAQPFLRNVLIVCPASLKTNWLLELKKWNVHKTLPIRIADGSRFPANGLVITNYDQLAKVPTHSAYVSNWDLIIFDEGQYLKNPKSQRTQHATNIAKHAKQVLLLSGTPLENRPVELWPLLQILDPEEWDPAGVLKGQHVGAGENAGFYRYAQQYCNAHERVVSSFVNPRTGERILKKVWDISGASNLPELQTRLKSTLMIRRLKQDVLTELPPKRRQIILLPAERTGDGEHLDYQPLYDTLPASLEECLELLHRSQLPEFKDWSKIRHEQAMRKIPYVLDHVRNVFANGIQKLVLFAHHINVLDGLRAGLDEFNPAIIVGSTTPEDRQGQVDRFQEDGSCRLFLGSLKAAGVGLTLTAASHVVMAEADYNPSVNNQAEDRTHRKGQMNSVLIQYILQDETLDAHLVRLVVAKQDVVHAALDLETSP